MNMTTEKYCFLFFSDLWGVFNNAGIDFTAEAELTPIDSYHKISEVNLYGLVRVTKAFLPLIRKSKGAYTPVEI